MKTTAKFLSLFLALILVSPLFGQYNPDRDLQQFRSPDQRGVAQFEALQMDREYEGMKVRLGGAFAVQFQGLRHTNSSANDTLMSIGNNFNLPTANLDLDVALADGLRMHMRTYLSSRHHPDSWVKGGYVQVSKLDFIKKDFLKSVMDITTIKIGLMEINYGDYHFRRTDNARAIYNPFVGNLIMDAFNTEAGAEIYVTPGDFLFMGGITNGKLNQSVAASGESTPAFLAKAGWDKQMNEDLRLRLTSSLYTSAEGNTNFLYFGDRAGSRFYLVMEPLGSNPTSDFRSGRFSPNFINQVTAIMVNPFVKYKGLEFFGTYEMTSGKIATEPQTRTWNQLHGELVYRFGDREQFYAGGKYNVASGGLTNFDPTADPTQVSIDRLEIAAGWYLTKNVMVKAEFITQNYNDFPGGELLSDGNFNGGMFEAVISF